MRNKTNLLFIAVLAIHLLQTLSTAAQTQWTDDGKGYYDFSKDGVVVINLLNPQKKEVFLAAKDLTPAGQGAPLEVQSFQLSPDKNTLLLFVNTKRVWRENTRGDYWLYSLDKKTLTQVGKGLAESSLMFAKFSPDGKQVAYVSKHNIYIENIKTQQYQQITKDGTERMINGTFDWAYEEEFGTKDGFRWSSDGNKIAFWKQDAKDTRHFYMINNTDSLYSFIIPVEYPKVGLKPSATSLWVYDLKNSSTKQLRVPGDPSQHYIPRMEWTLDSKSVILQQLNRKQNESKIILADANSGETHTIHTETDKAWVDIKARWNNGDPSGWDWVDGGKAFIWLSEKSGWRQIYKIDLQGKETLLSKDDFDIIQIDRIDPLSKSIYFSASPENATQKHLYLLPFSGGKAKRLTPKELKGTNKYNISPNGKIAILTKSSTTYYGEGSIISLPDHTELVPAQQEVYADSQSAKTEFFQITTIDGITLDGWMVKPKNFDPQKKYPIVFYVYGEPASQTVTDNFYTAKTFSMPEIWPKMAISMSHWKTEVRRLPAEEIGASQFTETSV